LGPTFEAFKTTIAKNNDTVVVRIVGTYKKRRTTTANLSVKETIVMTTTTIIIVEQHNCLRIVIVAAVWRGKTITTTNVIKTLFSARADKENESGVLAAHSVCVTGEERRDRAERFALVDSLSIIDNGNW